MGSNSQGTHVSTLRLIDLFCGAGGLTLGFADRRYGGGFKEVFALDSDWAAIRTHALNFRTEPVHAHIESWLAQDPQVPEADVVVAGLPCQGFSLLNKNRLSDARRELWQDFLHVVKLANAPVFIIENVPEMLTSAEYPKLVEAARLMGFAVVADVLNAADFGTPQHRKRAILVGWRPDRAKEPAFPPLPLCGPQFPQRWKTVRDAIGQLPAPEGVEVRHMPPPLDLHFGRTPTDKSVERYRAVPPGGNRFDLQKNAPHITPECWIRKTSGGTDLFGRLWWDRPSVTIRTEFFKPEKGRYLHPVADRPITHREAARLMGFPDDFRFVGSKIEIAKQIGNAVPPELAGALARMTWSMLKKAEGRYVSERPKVLEEAID